ncbi:hypothetical protein ATANTOWER_027564 [Ataeniobius toweri]|uniref:Uncharacterized protein n=1 Tax=Ataeniobius toweri TaxID=208326 RepID=A0ABU7BHW8_9TELE|nr:hypothetical protein [Ataeniobius toweri]
MILEMDLQWKKKTDQVKPCDLVFLSCLWFITAGYVRTAGRAKIDVQNKENMSSLSIPRTDEAVLSFLAHQLCNKAPENLECAETVSSFKSGLKTSGSHSSF